MIRVRKGTVTHVLTTGVAITEVIVTVEGVEAKAVNYNLLTGPVNVGDQVVLNTTAVHKGLGTGGNHFIMANLSFEKIDPPENGHIMKVRYTPSQVKCLTVEEHGSPYREAINDFSSLTKMPVVIATLHSMLAAIAVAAKSVNPNLSIAYIMTDGAALPLPFSKLSAELKNKGLIDATITVGNAFGGDYEAVNIYTGLIAAKEVVKADIAIVAMGPGIVGTDSKYGFTGIEQAEIINATNLLGGQPIAVPRISFADQRQRHQGISHHSQTTLGEIALTSCLVTIPEMDLAKQSVVARQLSASGISQKHKVITESVDSILDVMQEKYNIKVTTMGRSVAEDREFFMTAAAAGITAGKLATKKLL